MNYLLTIIALLLSLATHAQFFRGIGIMGGLTLPKQKFEYKDPDDKQKKKFLLGYNGEVFAEFGNSDRVRWQTEIEYNKKGSKDKTDSATYKNRLTYLSWNNYLKIRFEYFEGVPYFLIGPRIEYKLNERMQTPTVTEAFHKFQVSPDVGVGWEFVTFSRFKPVAEIHYNPDIYLNAYKTDHLHIKNRAWEFRVGVKFLMDDGGEKCPPVYR